MTDFISIIGTIASVGSIPLAIYFFLKNAEEKKDRVRREIVKSIAFQIGNGRIPTSFEIQSIINSKCRERKLKLTAIDINDVIEDLVAEVITTPIISSETKNDYIYTFNLLYTRGQVLQMVDNLTTENNAPVEENIRQLIKTKQVSDEEFVKNKKRPDYYSSPFGISAVILTIISLLSMVSSDTLNDIADFFSTNKDTILVGIGSVISLVAGIITIFLPGVKNKSK